MYEAIVMGASAGGLEALREIISMLPADFPAPVLVVSHIAPTSQTGLVDCLSSISAIKIKEAEAGELIKPGTIYFAPPAYHLLIERDRTLSLSVDPRVNYSCPSIDVLFESAADAYADTLIGVILTGANEDGSEGLRLIKDRGGLTVVQNPLTAKSPFMPQSALSIVKADFVADLEDIAPLLLEFFPSLKTNGEKIYG